MVDLTPTRSALMELREERHSMREAYVFLDEKRTLLAGALVQEVSRHGEASRSLADAFSGAVLALREALVRHGLESLQCQPAPVNSPETLQISESAILGVSLFDADVDATATPAPAVPSRVRACTERFREVARCAARLAALNGNLSRLYREYQRTERRARALEDVLLPELEEAARQIDDHLDALDLEEAVRVRCIRRP